MIGDNRGIFDDVEDCSHNSLSGIDIEMISHSANIIKLNYLMLPPSQMVMLWGGMRRCFKLEGLQILTIIQRLKGQSRVRCSKQDLFYASRFNIISKENIESIWFLSVFQIQHKQERQKHNSAAFWTKTNTHYIKVNLHNIYEISVFITR